MIVKSQQNRIESVTRPGNVRRGDGSSASSERKKMRSRSTDHLNYSGKENIDSGTLKRMLKGFHPGNNQERHPSDNSPLTSPEGGALAGHRGVATGRSMGGKRGGGVGKHSYKYSSDIGFSSEPEGVPAGKILISFRGTHLFKGTFGLKHKCT